MLKTRDNLLVCHLYKSRDVPSYPSCQHATKSYRCSTLLMQDVRQFHKSFYSHEDKVGQDDFIKYYQTNQMKRPERTGNQNYKKNSSVNYYVKIHESSKQAPVYHKAFLGVEFKKREDLPSDLTISRVWRQYYKESEDDPSLISVTCYNIGFGSHQTDFCSTCLQLEEKIEAEKDGDLKKSS
ncbi:hypothetical protein HHI36_023196 [Cryptolaemus montrouzieri]|uniref:Uncharacterized protein n=1 Tax=Cryptolaemus montrouzieri TaxID=559131 RepID=A0ABD2PFM0_9CUCU